MEKQLIGVVTKPQALKGQFRIKPSINNFKLFKKFSNVFIDNKEYRVESCSLRDAFVIVKLESIDTCEQAEMLRNKQVFAEMEIEVETHFDLNNFDVIIDGENVGKIIEINNFGSKDILTISGKIKAMIPVIDGLIKNIDESSLQVVINKNIFEQVAVYED